MTSYFGNPEIMFFGTGLQTFLLMFLSSLVCSITFLINFEFLYNKLINLTRSKKDADNDFGCEPAVKIEEFRTDANPAVEVHNLTKVYPNGFQAVSNVSFSIYPGEMIGLLGKNGAGKSTTMNVIAGFHEASEGKVLVNGIDMGSRRNEAIGTLSFCPQEDRFFYRLTVLEHLKFVCLLKGAKYNAADANQLLKDLGIDQKSGAKPRNISGGQKRRVCIAMAYVAQSPLIILDEPTSAVDAATRKTLWSFFQAKQRENPQQAVILCTHFMQEADVLSQRIAIISDGCLRAFGSSPYLKGLFGVGYTVSFHSNRKSEVEKIVMDVLSEGTAFRQTSETESAFQVPMESSAQLCSILGELERRDIEYNFNASTLENVFVVLSTPPALIDEEFTRNNDSADGNLNGSTETVDDADGIFSEQTGRPSDAAFSIMETFLLQFKFSILVDFVRLFRKNWAFFLGYTIFFVAFPQLVLLLCNIDNIIETSDPLEDGNITINMLTINQVPKIALFGDAPGEKIDLLRNAIGVNGLQIDRKYTEQKFLDAYLKHPLSLYDEYSFMVSWDAEKEKFGCVLNSNFESSESLCKLTMVNIYNKETGNRVEVAMKMYREKPDDHDFGSYDYSGNEHDGPSHEMICKGSLYHYIAPVIYFCLLFHILRLEAQRNELSLSPFYMANGANPLFSLLNRIAGLILIVLIYLMLLLLIAEIAGYGFFSSPNGEWAPVLNGKNIGFFFLFSVSFACFAILFGKMSSSVILLLFVSAITGVLYMIFFAQKSTRKSSMETSKWFFLLVYPGYILPIAVYLTLICLIESLTLRLVVNTFAYLIGRRTTPPMTSPDDDIAISAHEVSHTYFSTELEVPCCCCCKGRSRKCSVFKLTRALKGMSLQVPKNTCYALLGVNGAGKSTMFEILTGGNRLQRGHVSILNYSLLWKPLAIMKEIGYCSQKDKIPGYLTGNTILRLFGQLRGLSDDAIESQKQYMVKVMDVGSHMNKPISGCSGGTKRKLSTMVAFIGFPKIIILDESTTGVDPITRMNFGKLIRKAKKNGSTIIISSHTMEECESAADSICIMTRGKKHCEGTAEELKAQYGKFYSVTIKVPEHSKEAGSCVSLHNNNTPQQPPSSAMATNNVQINIVGDQADASAVVAGPSFQQQQNLLDLPPPPPPYSAPESVSTLLTQQFAGAELQYSFSAGLFRHLFFNIPKQGTRLSELFLRLDAMKRQQLFAECIVNTASLEHIFMQIAMEDEYAKNNPTAATENP